MTAGRSREWYICRSDGWRGRSYQLSAHKRDHRDAGNSPPEFDVQKDPAPRKAPR